MKLFLRFLFDVRVLSVLGLLALAIFLFLGADVLRLGLSWAVAALLLALLVYGAVWLGKKLWAARAARRLAAGIEDEDAASRATDERDRAEVGNLRARLDEAVKTITTSKLGQSVGKAALYELPWYMVIGNPAAGKSTAIAKSGLNFPFADKQGSAVQGIGGTRNCDWFFTTEGILLDTAGRYSVHEEDRRQWLGFLKLLKRTRPLAPINGILIAVSIAELSTASPEAANLLAKNLRQRVQELTETLEVFAPVYLVFTKMDLVSGFVEFFADRDSDERDKVWGATLPYKLEGGEDALASFDPHFDELGDGLKESTLARMSLARGQALPVGVLSFPLEFQALKPMLRAFVATLFEENPFQFKPVFRGFYFTSSVQEGEAQSHASADVARQFGLQTPRLTGSATIVSGAGYFLRDLFRQVVFADRGLVKQYASRGKQRLRMGFFGGGVAALALMLGAWAWAYQGNRQLMQSVEADLRKVVSLQAERTDLASRLEALEVLQQRIEQMQALRDNRPMGLSLGLYQGEAIERKLRVEYFEGVRQLLLRPVAQGIEGYLAEVNQNAGVLQPVLRAPLSAAAEAAAVPGAAASAPVLAASGASARSRFTDLSPGNTEEAYNALKTYLMMAERERMEQSHLADQLTRFWRVWLDEHRGTLPRDQLLRSAERVMAFSLANLQDEAFPVITPNLGLVDQTRDNLRKVMRGMPARERVYAELKARAATRYPGMTVARILTEAGQAPEPGVTPAVAGSYAISGTFTRQAWEGYVQAAIKDAATAELQRVDWVLNAAQKDDLSLEGSPEQVRAALTELYKTEYVKEWQRFVQGVSVASFVDYADAVRQLNRLGEPRNSPLKAVFDTLFEQTSWDNPSLLNERLGKAQKGIVEWFKQSVLNLAPSRVEVGVNLSGADAKQIPMGPVGREFAGLTQVMLSRDGKATALAEYLKQLSGVREAFNTLNNQGDKGPGSGALMAATLEGVKSPLGEALNYVDSSMLAAMPASQRNALRPLLVRPLVQAYAVLVPSAETDLNRRWEAEVYGPFQRTLAAKYPFNATARVEAGAEEIAALFGPAGAIAKFGTETLGRLVTRRGPVVDARTWADLGITLRPEFAEGYGRWVAPLDGAAAGAAGAAPAGGGGTAPAAAQTAFQILPQGAPGLLEYTVTVDGQSLRYRNTAATWTDMVWPSPTPQPGVRITGVTLEGKQVDFLDERGAFGMNKMFDQAKIRKLPNGDNELTWSNGPLAVTVHLRLLKAPGAAPAPTAAGASAAPAGGVAALRGLKLPALVVGRDGVAAAAPGAVPGAAAVGRGADAPVGEKR